MPGQKPSIINRCKSKNSHRLGIDRPREQLFRSPDFCHFGIPRLQPTLVDIGNNGRYKSFDPSRNPTVDGLTRDYKHGRKEIRKVEM